jgi:hypothetical protein
MHHGYDPVPDWKVTSEAIFGYRLVFLDAVPVFLYIRVYSLAMKDLNVTEFRRQCLSLL